MTHPLPYPYTVASAIRVNSSLMWDGRPCSVISFLNMYTANLQTRVSFEVIIEQARPNTVHVGYIDVRTSNGNPSIPGGYYIGAGNKRTGCDLRASWHMGMPSMFYPTNGTWITFHIGTGTDPLNPDTDGDGLPDGDEVNVWGSDPLKYSTAGDWLPDGWKAQYGIHPTNNVANRPAVGGMTHFQKYCHGCDPRVADTDGDGVDDIDEIPKSPGSDPSDPMDGGNPTNCVTVKFTVGDPSSSQSERWELDLTDLATGITRHVANQGYGTVTSLEHSLVKGKTYSYAIRWTGTNRPEGPDYDWQCLINDSAVPGLRQGLYGTGLFFIEDPDSLLNVLFNGDDINFALNRKGIIHVPKFELKVSHPMGNSPFGSPAKYHWTPNKGSADNLFSTWTGEQFKIDVVTIPQIDLANLPNNAITWTASSGEVIPNNSLSHTFTWSSTGVKTITVNFPLWGFSRTVHVDVPNVGILGENAVIASLLLDPLNVVSVGLIGTYAQTAISNANDIYPVAVSEKDAFRHAYWNALCVSSVLVNPFHVLSITTAHEFTNRADGQQAFNSTMDLYNNAVGRTMVHMNLLLAPDVEAIAMDFIQKFPSGAFMVWAGEGSEGASEGILIKSNYGKFY